MSSEEAKSTLIRTRASDEIKPTLIRTRAVQKFFGGVSRMWLHRRLRDDATFPRPVWIGGERFFRLADLEKYAKDAENRPPPPKSQNLKSKNAA